jgi:helix-turn-helix protein
MIKPTPETKQGVAYPSFAEMAEKDQRNHKARLAAMNRDVPWIDEDGKFWPLTQEELIPFSTRRRGEYEQAKTRHQKGELAPSKAKTLPPPEPEPELDGDSAYSPEPEPVDTTPDEQFVVRMPRTLDRKRYKFATDVHLGSAIDELGLDVYQFRVHGTLCRHLNRYRRDMPHFGYAFPTIERIAKLCGISERKVITVIRELEDLKLWDVSRKHREANLYRPRPAADWCYWLTVD